MLEVAAHPNSDAHRSHRVACGPERIRDPRHKTSGDAGAAAVLPALPLLLVRAAAEYVRLPQSTDAHAGHALLPQRIHEAQLVRISVTQRPPHEHTQEEAEEGGLGRGRRPQPGTRQRELAHFEEIHQRGQPPEGKETRPFRPGHKGKRLQNAHRRAGGRRQGTGSELEGSQEAGLRTAQAPRV